MKYVGLFRSADHDRRPGGLWEILSVVSHAWGNAEHQRKSLLEQVRENLPIVCYLHNVYM